MISGIVYTSNSGYTAEYAHLLGELTGLPVTNLRSGGQVKPDSEVIYLGWLIAGRVKDYALADRLYRIRAVCAVGMSPAGHAAAEKLRKQMKLGVLTPVFMLQGGFDMKRLHGPYRWIMQLKCKDIRRRLEQKERLSPPQQLMYTMVTEGGSAVDAQQLSQVVAWYEETK